MAGLLSHGHDATHFWLITEDGVTHSVTKAQIATYLQTHTFAQALAKFQADIVAPGLSATVTMDFDSTDGTPKGITFVWLSGG